MDLGAFENIELIEKIMSDNGISVPRLRGLRLMSLEEPSTMDEIEAEASCIGLGECEDACQSEFVCKPSCYEISERTRRLQHKYLVYADGIYNPIAVRWNAIHGKKRKLFKYKLKMAKRRVFKNFLAFNRYCGRNDVLYIHARIGGGNWPYYRKEVENQPWFIEKVDDPFDSTYCDIYARIKPVEGIEEQEERRTKS